jgi:arylsulfatase A-like enzyme
MPDIAPTILSFFGLKTPSIIQGRSLLPSIQGEKTDMDFGVSGFKDRSWSLRNFDWSYYLWLGRQAVHAANKKPELYKYDPEYLPPKPSEYVLGNQAEKENLIESEPEIAKQMDKKLRKFIEDLTPSPGDLSARDFMKRNLPRR